jgi:Protein of unknown function (DUF3891)
VVLRRDADGVLAIGQASHAWLSGQLARAWGNEQFGTLDPHEEVCLAAEQHDVGMAAWDLTPTFNSQTGLPHGFTEMPIETHMELWRAGPKRLLTQSRYAALLVSMHGMRLYEKRDLTSLPATQADEVAAFLAYSRDFQGQLMASLGASEAQVNRNSDLIWTWDFLSLALCLDWAPCQAGAVPTTDGPTELQLLEDGVIDPWPFRTREAVTVKIEGRRLAGAYASEAELADALASARWETVAFELRSA